MKKFIPSLILSICALGGAAMLAGSMFFQEFCHVVIPWKVYSSIMWPVIYSWHWKT
jgi:fucose permease